VKKRPIDNKCLRKTFRSNAAFRALGDIASFQSGGCWIAARAIQRKYGGKLVAVASSRHAVEHVVVERDGLYYDSEGAQTAAQLLQRMARDEFVPSPRIAPFRATDLYDIPVDERKAGAVQALFDVCASK